MRYSGYYTKGEKFGIGVVATIIGGVVLFGACDSCAQLGSNKKIVDLTKSFNAALEETDSGVSITYINQYYDYEGSQIQFVTQDNLLVLADTKDVELVNQPSIKALKEYASALAGSEGEVMIYDELQELSEPNPDSFNKSYIDLNYNYNHVIFETENGVVIADVENWRDYKDNKIQIELTDGTILLKDFDKIKLIDDSIADENSLYNYALTLAGDESKVVYYKRK